MKTTRSALSMVLTFIACNAVTLPQAPHPNKSASPTIPHTWDDSVIPTLEVPLANPIGSPKHVSADYYYRIPVRPIYKQYPVYAPGREPAGYMEWLKKQEPVILWDDTQNRPKLDTEDQSRRGCLQRSGLRRCK